MPRRTFKPKDLAPLRRITEQVLEKEPDAAVVVSAAAPFKRRIPKAPHEARVQMKLPVDLRSKDEPQGVPLHAIAREARKEAPGLSGISVTPGGVSLKFKKEPSAEERGRIEALLNDSNRLEGLRPPPTVRPLRPGLTGPTAPGEEIPSALHDPEASDTEWLGAFRQWAMTHLVPPPQE